MPSEAELRIAQAQLVGWLEGLFHGIQTALFAQQMAARAQLDEMRRHARDRGGARAGATATARGSRGPYRPARTCSSLRAQVTSRRRNSSSPTTQITDGVGGQHEPAVQRC